MSKAELIIGALDLSPFLVKAPIKNANSCRLSGLSEGLEQDLYRILHPPENFWTGIRYWNRYRFFYCSWLPKSIGVITSKKYLSDGRLKLRVGIGDERAIYLFLINTDNEWWQPTQPKRKALTRMKPMS